MSRRIIFITGGAKSGKSSFALRKASDKPGSKAYIATAEALDMEMKERIEKHRCQRGKDWVTFEEPLRLSKIIKDIGNDYRLIIVDCLTLWLSNLIHAGAGVDEEIDNLTGVLEDDSILTADSSLILVSNEVGWGIVPENEMARKFRDLSGAMNQIVSGAADEVYLMVSGIPLPIKGEKE